MAKSASAHPAAALRYGRRKRRLAAVGVAAFVTTMGSFAAAAVITTNEVQSTFELTDCLSKTASQDSIDFGANAADNYYINFDNTTTAVDPVTNVAVLHETLTVRAPAGFITKSTDTFTVDATACGNNFDVRLVANPINTFGEPDIAGNWADKGVLLYLSEVAAPGDDFTVVADWDQTPLIVTSAGVVTNASTGLATLADNSTLTVGFQLNGGAPAGAAGEFNFQVEFIPLP